MSVRKKVIFLVDMNAFFASVHQAEDPSLRGKPVIVGGARDSRKGIVLAKSYECLDYGPVKTAMTMAQALALCPQALVVRPNHDLYQDYAQRIRKILADFSPLVEPNSIDEAFLDMTGSQRLFGPPKDAARSLQKEIYDQLGLASSVGIGESKIAAKMAADFKKPWGISTLWPEEVGEKLHPLPVGALNGVGKQSKKACYKRAILTIGELAQASPSVLEEIFGKTAEAMRDRANGLGDDLVSPQRQVKNESMGKARTYEENITDIDRLLKELYRLTAALSLRLRKEKKKTRTISVSIKDAYFISRSKSRTLTQETDLTEDIYQTAEELTRSLWKKEAVRLLGISLENLSRESSGQVSLFDREEARRLQETLDDLEDKYGEASVRRGRLLK